MIDPMQSLKKSAVLLALFFLLLMVTLPMFESYFRTKQADLVPLLVLAVLVATALVILSFGDKGTEDLHTGVPSRYMRRFPSTILNAAVRKLDELEAATALEDLGRIPGNRLEQLRGEWAGFWSIRVNNQWRIVFRWKKATPKMCSRLIITSEVL